MPAQRTRKRADGEGMLRFEESKGLWIGRLMVGHRPDGKPDIREVSSKKQTDARRKLDELKKKRDSGILGDAQAGRETVAAFLLRWLQAISGTMEPDSLRRHVNNVHRHISPIIGRHKLAELKPEHLVGMFAALREQGKPSKKKGKTEEREPLSPRSLKYCYTTTRLALDMALKWGSVQRNVARAIDAPKVPRVEIQALKAEEVAQALASATAEGDPLAPLYEVAALSGCRLGEMLALKWSDLDMESGTISINRTLVGIREGVPDFQDPKTSRSRRAFKLPADAVLALRMQKDRQTWEREKLAEAYRDFDLVFATPYGTPNDAANVLKRFKRALKKSGLPTTYTFHSLRHTAATMMLAAGISPKVVADRLGHSSAAFTLDRYTHAIKALDDDAASSLQSILTRAKAARL